MSIGLRYILLFEWSEYVKYHVAVMPKGQLSNFKTSVWNALISETGIKCNSLFRDAVIDLLLRK